MRRLLLVMMSLGVVKLAAAQAYQPDFNPSLLKGPAAGGASEVMVLGSPHLSQLPKPFDATTLSLLNERLAGWRPQAISIEALSGMQCDFLRRYPARYADTVKSYCPDTAPARAATGLDVPAATARIDQLLAAWPAAPTAAQRRQLAATLLAGGEHGSAVVQWLRLPQAERKAGDGLDQVLVERLNALQARADESYQIAAQLAARLGLERLYTMDDHTADTVDDDQAAMGAAMMKAWDNPASRQRRRDSDELAKGLGTPSGMLAMYRAYNAPGQGKLVFDSDFGAALNEPSPQHYGRGYLGYWETRNLRMASNIRSAMGQLPGQRMLVVVGASHKGYLEAYLHQMHDVRVVDSAPLLR